MKLPTHIYPLNKPVHSGPRVLLLGGTHGDERAAVMVVHHLVHLLARMPAIKLACNLFVGFGNPKAIKTRTRAATPGQKDLNRCFTNEILQANHLQTPDINRARELAPFLRTIDLLIDLHSTSAPSTPFLCFEKITPELKQVCAHLPANHILTDPYGIIEPDVKHEHPTMDSYVNRHGGLGICFETGQAHVLRGTKTLAKQLLNSLISLDLIQSNSAPMRASQQTCFALNKRIDATEPIFRFQKGLHRSWTPLKEGELIGTYESGKEERAPYACRLLFPKAEHKIKQGEDIYFLAKQLDN
jgi:succinylglutamate desuccinylase